MIGREELRLALAAWLPSGRRRRSSLPANAVQIGLGFLAGVPAPSRPSAPDPWAASQQALDRKLDEFAAAEKQLAKAAHRDGLDEDGPMVPTLHALRLCLASLREITRVLAQIPSHACGQINEAIAASRTVAEAETDRFRAEIEHTEIDIVHRVAHAIAASADRALARRVRVFDRTTAGAAALILVVTAAGCLAGGYRWGRRDEAAAIAQTDWRLRAAFAHGGLGAELWALLMEENDITDAVRACRGGNLIDTGTPRRACRVPLWIAPADTAPPQMLPRPSDDVVAPMPVLPAPTPPATPARPPARTEPVMVNPFGILPTPPQGPVHFGPEGSR